MTCALFICAIDLAFPYASRIAMNTLLPQSMYQAFFTVIAIFILAYVGKRGLLYLVVSYWGHTFGVYVEADMRRDLFSHLESLSFGFYDKNRTGALMSRVTNDLFEVTELAHHGPEDLFISTVTLVGAFTHHVYHRMAPGRRLLCGAPLRALHHPPAAENAPGQPDGQGGNRANQRHH